MRLFIILATLLLALPSHAQKQQNAPDKHNDIAVPSPAGSTVSAPVVAPSVGYPTTVIQQASPQQQPYDWPQIFTGIGLIVVGFFGIRVALRTLRKIEIQADAAVTAAKAAVDMLEQVKAQSASTEKAANAARDNAQAAINAERAWIKPLLERVNGDQWILWVFNNGRTPAQMVGYRISFIYLNRSLVSPEYPEEPSSEYPVNLWINGATQDGAGDGRLAEFDYRRDFEHFIVATPHPGKTSLLIYGSVKYIAAIEIGGQETPMTHSTTFMYDFDLLGGKISYVPAYTKYN
ncbi:MAG: hypothetical protein ABSD98_16575 [Candidatus Korobacteraceae bacterium]|jgi:hypothetical protein